MIIQNTKQLNEILTSSLKDNTKTNTLNINYQDYYNCWGFIAHLFKWLDNLKWLNNIEMEQYLENNTKPTTQIKVGNIAIFRNDYEGLEHTALIIKTTNSLNDLTIIHKPGDWELEYGQYFHDHLSNYGNNITIRKLI